MSNRFLSFDGHYMKNVEWLSFCRRKYIKSDRSSHSGCICSFAGVNIEMEDVG